MSTLKALETELQQLRAEQQRIGDKIKLVRKLMVPKLLAELLKRSDLDAQTRTQLTSLKDCGCVSWPTDATYRLLDTIGVVYSRVEEGEHDTLSGWTYTRRDIVVDR